MDIPAYIDTLAGLEVIMKLPATQERVRRAVKKAHQMLQELKAENDYLCDLTAADRIRSNG